MKQLNLFEDSFALAIEKECRNNTKRLWKEKQSLDILRQIGLSEKHINKRTALTLLALLGVKENVEWRSAKKILLRIVDIMAFMNEHYDLKYAPNSRETIRKQSIQALENAGIIEKNPDDPTRPTNSGKTVYGVTDYFLVTVKSYGLSEWEKSKKIYIQENEIRTSEETAPIKQTRLIKLSSAVLENVKIKAIKEGLPYNTDEDIVRILEMVSRKAARET